MVCTKTKKINITSQTNYKKSHQIFIKKKEKQEKKAFSLLSTLSLASNAIKIS